MAFENYELNEMQFDALKEIGNIGSGHAASALSSMLDRPIDMNVPQINILDYNEVVNNLGGPENVLAGILMSLTGDVSGMIMFLIHKPFVKILLSNLLGMDIEDNFDLDEMSQSAIKEVGNIKNWKCHCGGTCHTTDWCAHPNNGKFPVLPDQSS